MHKSIVLMATLFLTGSAASAADDKDRENRIKQFVVACDKARDAGIKRWPSDFQREKQRLNKMQRATVGSRVKTRGEYHFDTKDEKLSALKSQQAKLDALQTLKKQLDANDPPYICAIIESKPLAVGDLGRFDFGGLNTLQVVDENNAIGRFFWSGANGGPKEQLVWVKGFATKNVVDGLKLPVEGAFEVTGTTTYRTATGSQTVVVIEPFDIVPHLPNRN